MSEITKERMDEIRGMVYDPYPMDFTYPEHKWPNHYDALRELFFAYDALAARCREAEASERRLREALTSILASKQEQPDCLLMTAARVTAAIALADTAAPGGADGK